LPCKDGREWIHDALNVFLVVSEAAASLAQQGWERVDFMTHSEHLWWCQQQQQALPCKKGKEWIHDALKAFLVVSDHG